MVLAAIACGVSGPAMAGDVALEDIQIGEIPGKLRVALVCSQACDIENRGPEGLMVVNMNTALKIDLGARSKLARSIELRPGEAGTALIIDMRGNLVVQEIASCEVRNVSATCVDYVAIDDFAPSEELASAPLSTPKETAPKPLNEPQKDPAKEPVKPVADAQTGTETVSDASPENDIPYLGVAIAPALRQETDLRGLELAPPERFAPPFQRIGADGPGPQPEGTTIGVGGMAQGEETEDMLGQVGDAPIDQVEAGLQPQLSGEASPEFPAQREISERAAAIVAASFDLKTEAEAILSRQFDDAVCVSAMERLASDAWALDAMIDLGFCKAIGGDLDAADDDFMRLLAYTPDNYQALVGRALVAAQRGQTDTSLDLFQAALNALPPISESNRIVAAMDRL